VNLYKYRSDSEYTEKIFTAGEVWLSTAAQLNDPFEGSLHEIAPNWISAKVRAMKVGQLAGFTDGTRLAKQGIGSPRPNPAEAELLSRLRNITDFDQAYQALRDFMSRQGTTLSDPETVFNRLEEQLNEVGIFSLSALHDNPLMWAHYAGDHKGLCLGFEIIDGSPLAQSEHCLRVVYADTIPKIGDGFIQQISISIDDRGQLQSNARIAFSDPAVRAAISTKSLDWEYEREWRYVQQKSGVYPWPGPLTEIVFGLRCSSERRKHYLQLATKFIPNDVRIYEMRKVANSNSLERVSLPLLKTNMGITRRVRTADKSATRRDRNSIQCIDQIADLVERGQLTAALQALRPALEDIPESAELWRLKGIALGKSADHEAALNCFIRAIEIQPDFFSAWYQRAVALSAIGCYEEAVTSYKQASTLNPEDSSTVFNLGLILVHLNRIDEAVRHLLTAQKLGHSRAKYILQDLDGQA